MQQKLLQQKLLQQNNSLQQKEFKQDNNKNTIQNYLFQENNSFKNIPYTEKQRYIIENNQIYQIIKGGLGNQLFMIFNIISLGYEFNKKFSIIHDVKYKDIYYKKKNVFRKNFF